MSRKVLLVDADVNALGALASDLRARGLTVFNAAEECSSRILDVYATPNRTVDELIGAIRSDEMAFLRKFSDACHVELGKYSQY